MKKKVYQSPLTTLLIFIGILLLYNCQKEDVFTRTTETVLIENKKYNIQKLGSKELQEDTEIDIALQKIRNRLQSNVSNHSLTEKNVVIGDGLVILDTDIAKITIDSTITWTFKIETPTHEDSEIENFMIKKHGDVFSYYLIKYQDDDDNPETPHIAYLEQINGNALDTSNLNLSSRDAFDWEFGDGGGNDDCEGIVVGYEFQTCNQGGYHTAGTYCCQHVGAPHGCQTNSGFCGFTCNGTSEVEILDFSHCDAPVGDPVDGGNENPNDNQIGGGSGSGNGSDTVSTPVGLISNGDDPCNPAPEGDLNGNCALDFFEGCLERLNNGAINLLSSANLLLLEDFINENGCTIINQAFLNSAINALINGYGVNFDDWYIETPTPDDGEGYQGTKQLIPNPLILSNGTSIAITFGTTASDGLNANQLVSPDLVDSIKYAIEQANNNLPQSDQITSIYISATTNGAHSATSNHTTGTAADISRINGVKMAISGVTNQIIELQTAFDNFTYIRENFGPHFKHKYDIRSNTWIYNHPVGGHRDHIHVSVRR